MFYIIVVLAGVCQLTRWVFALVDLIENERRSQHGRI